MQYISVFMSAIISISMSAIISVSMNAMISVSMSAIYNGAILMCMIDVRYLGKLFL